MSEITRRNLLKTVSLAVAGAALDACIPVSPPTPTSTPPTEAIKPRSDQVEKSSVRPAPNSSGLNPLEPAQNAVNPASPFNPNSPINPLK